MASNRKPPQRISAPKADTNNPATFIFLHGFDDDADGWTNIAHQFHSASKLPHLTWIFPNAPHNHDANATAWYTPSGSISPIPVGRSSSDPEPSNAEEEIEEADSPEAEDEILASVEYVCSLIDEEVKNGVKAERIVVGGFSQGCAISLVTGLSSRYAGKLGGIVGLSGYLPKGPRMQELRKKYLKESETRVFLGHGSKDMLIPMRVFREAKGRVERIVGESKVRVEVYEGMGHVASGAEFRDMCGFLEEVLPE